MTDVRAVNLLVKAIAKKDIKYCKIARDIGTRTGIFDIKKHFKSGASGTHIVFAELLKETFKGHMMEDEEFESAISNFPVYAKIFLDPAKIKQVFPLIEPDYMYQLDGIDYELKVYERIVDSMLRHSPHFIPYIGSAECIIDSKQNPELFKNYISNLAEFESSSFQGSTRKMLKDASKNKLRKRLPVKVLLTGRAGSDIDLSPDANITSLYDILERFFSEKINDNTDKYLEMMLFQLTYTLQVMSKRKLSHNDLHTKNIMVLDLGSGKRITRYYRCYGKMYRISTRYIPYIFDWDLAYCVELGDNLKLVDNVFCGDYNICNEFNPKKDFYTIMSMMLYHIHNLDNYPYLKILDDINRSWGGYQGKTIEISKDVYNQIKKIRKFDDGISKEPTPMYMLNKQIINRIARESSLPAVQSLTIMNSFLASIEQDKGKYYLRFGEGYENRLSFDTDDLPTPEQVLRGNNFRNFEYGIQRGEENSEVFSLD